VFRSVRHSQTEKVLNHHRTGRNYRAEFS
jgi:hypothetical protein